MPNVNVAKNLAARTALTAQTGSLVSPTRKVMSVNWKQDYVDRLFIFLNIFTLGSFIYPPILIADKTAFSQPEQVVHEMLEREFWRTFWY